MPGGRTYKSREQQSLAPSKKSHKAHTHVHCTPRHMRDRHLLEIKGHPAATSLGKPKHWKALDDSWLPGSRTLYFIIPNRFPKATADILYFCPLLFFGFSEGAATSSSLGAFFRGATKVSQASMSFVRVSVMVSSLSTSRPVR